MEQKIKNRILGMAFVVCVIAQSLFGAAAESDKESGSLSESEENSGLISFLIREKMCVDCFLKKTKKEDTDSLKDLDEVPSSETAEMIEMFLPTCLDIYAEDNCGRNALHKAVMNRLIVNFEPFNSYKLYTADYDGRTPLHEASIHGHINAVLFLVARGINSDQQDNEGNSALHLAARNAHSEIITCLLKNGADKTKKNMLGQTAFDIALHEFDRDYTIISACETKISDDASRFMHILVIINLLKEISSNELASLLDQITW